MLLSSLPLFQLLLAIQGGAAPALPAETTETAEQTGPDFFLLLIALVAVFYFVMILPEKKNRKKRAQMLTELKKGDKVITTSGLHATVAMVKDDVVTLQVADGVRMRYSVAAIQSVNQEAAEKPAPAPTKEEAAS